MTAVSSGKPTGAVIELHYEDRDGQIRVVAPGKNIMALPVEMAVEACRAFKTQILFKDQFELLLDRLAEWLIDQRDQIQAAYLTVRDAGLLFLAVQQGRKRDAPLEASLSELDLQIANDSDYSLIRLSVLAIPNCGDEGLQSFLSPKMALKYILHGEGK